MLGKGKDEMIRITLIEANLQCIMSICLRDDKQEMIESDDRFPKANCSSRKNYLIKTAMLEKRLTFDNSLLSRKLTACHLTNL